MNFFVNHNCLASHPLYSGYTEADPLGKLIFIGLFTLSILSWILILYKVWELRQAKQQNAVFRVKFMKSRLDPLTLDVDKGNSLAPYPEIYRALKVRTLEILHKNQLFHEEAYLSRSDIDCIQAHLFSALSDQMKKLNHYVFILATIVGLAPFLGLLGTVWGILLTFNEIQGSGGAGVNHQMLGGLALALATTVIGLIIAIPALVANSYLRNGLGECEIDMEGFSSEMLAAVEMQYRKVE